MIPAALLSLLCLGPLRESCLSGKDPGAVFGTMDGTVLRAKSVSLKPTVILVPKEESLALLQEIIARHQGDVPVVLRLGRRFFTSCRKHTG